MLLCPVNYLLHKSGNAAVAPEWMPPGVWCDKGRYNRMEVIFKDVVSVFELR